MTEFHSTPPADDACAVSLVVVAYHRDQSLEHLLTSIGSDRSSTEVVVVNVEDDPRVRRVAESHDCRTIAAPNGGFAASVNLGVRASTAPVVVVANDDIVFTQGAVSGLAASVEQRGAVVAPKVVGPAGELQHTVCATVSLGSIVVEQLLLPDEPMHLPRVIRSRIQKWRAPTTAERVPCVAACAVAAPRQLLIDVPMPEQYFMYWEERDWFTRLERMGYVLWYDPEFVVRHDGGRSDVRAEKQRLLSRNAILCIRALYGPRQAVAARVIVFLWQLRLVIQAIVGRSTTLRRARLAGLRASLERIPRMGG